MSQASCHPRSPTSRTASVSSCSHCSHAGAMLGGTRRERKSPGTGFCQRSPAPQNRLARCCHDRRDRGRAGFMPHYGEGLGCRLPRVARIQIARIQIAHRCTYPAAATRCVRESRDSGAASAFGYDPGLHQGGPMPTRNATIVVLAGLLLSGPALAQGDPSANSIIDSLRTGAGIPGARAASVRLRHPKAPPPLLRARPPRCRGPARTWRARARARRGRAPHDRQRRAERALGQPHRPVRQQLGRADPGGDPHARRARPRAQQPGPVRFRFRIEGHTTRSAPTSTTRPCPSSAPTGWSTISSASSAWTGRGSRLSGWAKISRSFLRAPTCLSRATAGSR